MTFTGSKTNTSSGVINFFMYSSWLFASNGNVVSVVCHWYVSLMIFSINWKPSVYDLDKKGLARGRNQHISRRWHTIVVKVSNCMQVRMTRYRHWLNSYMSVSHTSNKNLSPLLKWSYLISYLSIMDKWEIFG